MVQATNDERVKVIEWFKYFSISSRKLEERVKNLEHDVEELKERLEKYDKLIKA